ncbi:TPA: 50S ribosomal protein L15 [bacterium]|nr:50S ribosomal protein L15 [bacterium]
MLDRLKRPKGSYKKPKRLGRGDASGHGGTSTKGTKGQLARKGGKEPGFEGGQMPIKLRIPKRGFSNPNRIEYQIVGLSSLNKFSENQEVDKKVLFESRLIKDMNKPVKILANGDINIPLAIKIDAISKSAKEKIEALGGKIL